MANKRLSGAFACWVSNVDALVSDRESSRTVASLAQLRAEMEAQAEQHRVDTMKKAFVKVQHAKVSSAFTAWTGFASMPRKFHP